ncbi:tRNA delta(2)-isopentenylpyrophosphate transferase [Sphingopyxis alaskensis RB2256]|uniref:tRNA dimethylallyltransferase n=1 Tax=Sphingopyxis alaskensis (strain DSM 13593 / LMG 18877 / RB2256) TaxID=317655 RepID=MIAA_SPHAL|nr:RecName: Full=tRNA dimethylallyltransferase; AltName: Full=Dimethylallyl diphosphate:tRNA dimethylallyltransferase; Short=DMAPP:tRNA dimethylallyltransferase; Short=DMATase; AltName: Full=Isopentenyl-diphosphate:tRNA isopentenyltransferase; Short=IPP transferase; Short=IPPT; Short=IPTase [Sphingopyxis alaskensis RB2256]ABF53182.1 tRNA delta(2)-isopentenylpyrophosphate transferase [Sphingopyxis alaskensis RB2256]
MALIAGPTASGKSALAVALAKALGNGTVVNADASQVYADLAILSARPTDDEMQGVPHRLFGHVDGSQAHNAARWADEAQGVIAQAHAAGRVPILVGGTGLYLRTLLYGIAPVPEIDPHIREAVRALPVAQAHAALAEADPAAAARLGPADTTRVARALEVVRSTGRTLASWQQAREGGIADRVALAPLVLLPPRDWLRDRCDVRLVEMFDGGAIDEVEALLARGLDPDLPVMRAIGVPQIAAFLDGTASRDEALAAAQAATRQYAKRQFTWFRHQPPASWPRHIESLSIDIIDNLAIKLRETVLTR